MPKEALLYEKMNDGVVHCFLCAHHCRIPRSHFGICGVRENREGVLYTRSYGNVVAQHVDPVEKKPLFHFEPGSLSYSIATIGCNFRCGFCQNWQISQTRESNALHIETAPILPEEIVAAAVDTECRSISYTYTEPTIYLEFALDTARLARKAGLSNIFVSNGFMTPEALDTVRPFLDAANIDLKSFSDQTYRKVCGGRLEPVLSTIKRMHDLKIWLEVTTLIVPRMNDSPGELRAIAGFLAQVGPDIPWHISQFHPDYKFVDRGSTPLSTLEEAFEIGKRAGLRYVYKGNVNEETDTFCYQCGERLIRRAAYDIVENRVEQDHCPRCGTPVDGRRMAGVQKAAGKA